MTEYKLEEIKRKMNRLSSVIATLMSILVVLILLLFILGTLFAIHFYDGFLIFPLVIIITMLFGVYFKLTNKFDNYVDEYTKILYLSIMDGEKDDG